MCKSIYQITQRFVTLYSFSVRGASRFTISIFCSMPFHNLGWCLWILKQNNNNKKQPPMPHIYMREICFMSKEMTHTFKRNRSTTLKKYKFFKSAENYENLCFKRLIEIIVLHCGFAFLFHILLVIEKYQQLEIIHSTSLTHARTFIQTMINTCIDDEWFMFLRLTKGV